MKLENDAVLNERNDLKGFGFVRSTKSISVSYKQRGRKRRPKQDPENNPGNTICFNSSRLFLVDLSGFVSRTSAAVR